MSETKKSPSVMVLLGMMAGMTSCVSLEREDEERRRRESVELRGNRHYTGVKKQAGPMEGSSGLAGGPFEFEIVIVKLGDARFDLNVFVTTGGHPVDLANSGNGAWTLVRQEGNTARGDFSYHRKWTHPESFKVGHLWSAIPSELQPLKELRILVAMPGKQGTAEAVFSPQEVARATRPE
jgi:hypothetical protein